LAAPVEKLTGVVATSTVVLREKSRRSSAPLPPLVQPEHRPDHQGHHADADQRRTTQNQHMPRPQRSHAAMLSAEIKSWGAVRWP